MKLNNAKIHFIGIGGVGMSGIAEICRSVGAVVTGSDLVESAAVTRLRSLGIKVFTGHHADHVSAEMDVVVYSSAVRADNPELLKARQNKIPLIPRAEALAELMRVRRGVAVGGSHGKTTTTSLIATVFMQAQLHPTVVIGGKIQGFVSNAQLGQGEWLIAEADESDGSFSKLNPEIAVITNIDNDHMEYFKTDEQLNQAFYQFALRVPFYGLVVACGDDERVRNVFKDFPKQIFFYGFNKSNDYQIIQADLGHYQVVFRGQVLGEFKLSIPGRHNILNAVACLIVGLRAGVDFNSIAQSLSVFAGVERRFHHLGVLHGNDIYADYAHHPTEIKATLQALGEVYHSRKKIAIFQPHRYSRTELCWNDFLTAFDLADICVVTDIYSAGENPIENITSELLAKAIKHPHVFYVKTSDLESKLSELLTQEGVMVFLGAGDIFKIAKDLLPRIS